MSALSLEELGRLDDLQAAYSEALDLKRMRDWLATFEEDDRASYICTSRDSHERGLQVAMMLDDCRDRLIDRCTFIDDIWAGTFQDYRTRHFAQRVRAARGDDGLIVMRTHFSVAFTPDDTGISALLATGTYEDVITFAGNQPLFVSRLALTDNAVLPRYLVYPV